MSGEFDHLVRLLPPPAGEVARPPWETARSTVGFDFPPDYREFVDRYGAGTITAGRGSLEFSVSAPCEVPWREGELAGFEAAVSQQIQFVRPLFAFEGADEAYWGGTVYPMYPDPGGLWAWGGDLEGNKYFWQTADPDPSRWPIVMWARGPATTHRFEQGMVAFLAAALSGSHPVVTWMAKPRVKWTMSSDWLRRGLKESAGPRDAAK
jgi:hypothetical protein